MKLPNFAEIAGVVDIMLGHWEICAIALVAFTILLIGLFKGFKRGLKAIILVAVIAGIGILAALIVQLIQKDVTEIIATLIAWVPTALFVLIIFIAAFVGYRRGLRKSLILCIHAMCAAALCITLFFICVSSAKVDQLFLKAADAIMGGEGALQRELGVSGECTTLKEVLAGFIPSLIGGEVGILLTDNTAYIMTVVDMAYRIVFALVLSVLYLLIIFILYIIYHACYSERKYRRKKDAAFAMNKTDCTYRKRPLGGGVIGAVRGLAVGLITLSFLGSAFYIVAGTGDGKLKDYKFGDPNTQFIYSVYRSVESYGAQGIYKVLNSVKDPEDAPYYLFAADLIFSGGLDDEKNGIDERIKFTHEFSAYTGFARDTLSLLLKYGEDELIPVLNGETSENTMNVVMNVMSDPAFQVEFESLVESFDAQTYIINFSLSMVNSVVAYADEMPFMDGVGAENIDLLKVLFKDGYLSPTIPDEREIIEDTGSNSASAADRRPCLSVNHLITKKDVQVALKLALSFLTEGEGESAQPLDLVKRILPEIEKLSIFGTKREEELNPVLGRLYCYAENRFLAEEGQDGIRYSEIKDANVNWSGEIRTLLGVAEDMFTLYGNVFTEGREPLDAVLAIFDEEDENYGQNIAIYDKTCNVIADSALIGRTLASGKILGIIRKQLSSVGNVYIPKTVVFENRYGDDGELISRGETFRLFYGLRLLGKNKDLTHALLNSSEGLDMTDILDKLAAAFAEEDSFGFKLSDYLTDSVLLRSVISSAIIEQGKDVLAVPQISLETDGEQTVNLILASQLKPLFDSLPDIIELIKPLTGGEVQASDIAKLIDDKTLNSLLDSGNGIIEGTVAKLLIDQFGGGDTIIIPAKLSDFESWVTVGAPGETRKLISAVKAMDIDFEKLLDGSFEAEDMFDVLNAMDDESIESLLDSSVMHYTVSDYLQSRALGFGDFEIIVPASSKTVLTDDVIPSLIARDELVAVIKEMRNFELSSDMEASDTVAQLVKHKAILEESDIISASVVNFVICNEDVNAALKIPADYLAAGSRSELENYGANNVWHAELPNLVTALDEIFGISEGGDFEINGDTVTERVNEILKSLNKPSSTDPEKTKLTVCYDSVIIRNEITVELDNALDGVVEQSVKDDAKEEGYYRKEELQALSDAAYILGLDMLNIDGDELTDKVKTELMNINEAREDFGGRTTLDVIYPSAIIRHMMTDELDGSLSESLVDKQKVEGLKNESGVYEKQEFASLVDGIKSLGITDVDGIEEYSFTDIVGFKDSIGTMYRSGIIKLIIAKQLDDNLTSGLIDYDVREDIKVDGIYPEQEVTSLIGALEELEMTDIGHIDENTFNEVRSFNSESRTVAGSTRLEVLYSSDIINGVITKSVRDRIDSNTKLADHEKAYRSDLHVYERREIKDLVALLGESDIDSYTLGSAAELRDYVSPGENRSYIISASLSKNLLDNNELIVPRSALEDDTLITAEELVNLINAFESLRGDAGLDNWNAEADMVVPEESARGAVINSLIMRATLSFNIAQVNSNRTVRFAKNNVTADRDAHGKNIAIISGEQLLSLFDILSSIDSGDGRLEIPSLNDLSSLKEIDVKLYYAFDETRYAISDLLTDFFGLAHQFETVTEDVAELGYMGSDVMVTESRLTVITEEDATSFIDEVIR